MTNPAKVFIDALILDLRANPGTSPEKAMAAIVIGTRKFRYCAEDFREMMSAMRQEYGWSTERWNLLLSQMLSEFKDQAAVNDLIRPA